MLTDEQKEDLNYLRRLKGVVIPPQYTFWLHHTSVNTPDKMGKYERCWTEIPTKEFVVRGEMSFVEAENWLREMVWHNKEEPNYRYCCSKNAMPFRIIAIQPRHKYLEKICTGDELKRRFYEEDGLGDFRHPKIAGRTHLFVFACKSKGKKVSEVDTIYVVREADLHQYVADIKELREQIIRLDMSKEQLGFDIDRSKRNVEENDAIKVLQKDATFHRFQDAIISPETGGFVRLAPYKQELIKMHKEYDETESAAKL